MSIQKQKSELRESLLSKRKSLSEKEWEDKSRQIISRVQNIEEYKESEIIHCFVSMNGRREVNTHEFITSALADGKRIIVPVTNFESNTLSHVEISSLDELEENKWEVLEPRSNKKESTLEPDLIIVPLLAADENFDRLGYGKGFYDRFLSNTHASKAGILFSDFIIDKVPVEDFDEKLDILITEDFTLRRNNH